MKTIVFGGAGFLGSHVADALTDKGHQVIVYDIKPSRYIKEGQEMIKADVLDESAVMKATRGVQFVYNFAGVTSIEEAAQKPLESVKSNILGNSIILEACRKAGVKRFIFASSLYVYSKAGSFYRSTKQACESLIEDYQNAFGLPYTILRYGSLYGPRADEANWIYNILKQAIREKKITRKGDGEEIREYIHILDAARLSVDILKPEYENQCVIISGNQQTKIKDLLTMIKEMLENKIKIDYVQTKDPEHYEITPYTFNPKLAKRIVNDHYVDLGQGLLEIMKDIFKDEQKESLYI